MNSEDKKLRNYPLANVVIQLTCLTNNTVVPCQVTDMKDGSFNVSYTPINTGKHHIMIAIFILFQVVHLRPPYATIGMKCWKMTEFGEDRKFGELCRVAISSIGDIAVSDATNKCIIILNCAYHLKHVITGKDDNQLRYPLGIVYSNKDTLLVIDGYNSKVLEFSTGDDSCPALDQRVVKMDKYQSPQELLLLK